VAHGSNVFYTDGRPDIGQDKKPELFRTDKVDVVPANESFFKTVELSPTDRVLVGTVIESGFGELGFGANGFGGFQRLEDAESFFKTLLRGKSDSVSLSEALLLAYALSFTDNPAVTSALEKEVQKTGADLISVSSDEFKELQKVSEDSVEIFDEFSYAFQPGYGDQIAMSETKSKRLSKPKTDSCTVSDDPVSVQTSFGALGFGYSGFGGYNAI
jgi:hypothetical protein